MKTYHKFVSPYIMWLVACLGWAAILTIFEPQFLLVQNPFFYILSGVALAYWLYFFMKGVTANMQASFRPHHITKLITTGVYGKIRHPIYSADIILGWGVFLAYPLTTILFAVVWLTIVMLVWIFMEEKALIDVFKDEYLEYQSRVPMVLPIKRI